MFCPCGILPHCCKSLGGEGETLSVYQSFRPAACSPSGSCRRSNLFTKPTPLGFPLLTLTTILMPPSATKGWQDGGNLS
jgi:hypothetical protein